jgi:hypothetical protein
MLQLDCGERAVALRTFAPLELPGSSVRLVMFVLLLDLVYVLLVVCLGDNAVRCRSTGVVDWSAVDTNTEGMSLTLALDMASFYLRVRALEKAANCISYLSFFGRLLFFCIIDLTWGCKTNKQSINRYLMRRGTFAACVELLIERRYYTTALLLCENRIAFCSSFFRRCFDSWFAAFRRNDDDDDDDDSVSAVGDSTRRLELCKRIGRQQARHWRLHRCPVCASASPRISQCVSVSVSPLPHELVFR